VATGALSFPATVTAYGAPTAETLTITAFGGCGAASPLLAG